MAKKVCPPKKKAAPKGLAGAAKPGGEPLEISIKRASFQLPLRDLFAAFALAGLLSALRDDSLAETAVTDTDYLAMVSYSHADAMMKRRLSK